MSLDDIEMGSCSSEDATSHPRDQIHVVSWNVARGSRLSEVIECLRSINADVVCLQETDRNARRTRRFNIAAEIASALKMNYAFGVEFEELSEGTSEFPAYHGQATLSPFQLTESRILRFRNQSRFWCPHWWVPRLRSFQRRLGGRIALVSKMRIAERTLAIYNLHLESRSNKVRHAQLSEILEDARQFNGDTPVILAGDFNFDVTESSAANVIADMCFHNPFNGEHMRTTPSNHCGRPGAIDGILLRGAIDAVATRVYSSVSASDHYPLSLTVKLR